MTEKPKGRAYTAVVTKVFPTHAAARAQGIQGEVTFSLDQHEGVWYEEGKPIQGNKVVLSDLRQKGKMWRAHNARFYRPEDEDQPELKF